MTDHCDERISEHTFQPGEMFDIERVCCTEICPGDVICLDSDDETTLDRIGTVTAKRHARDEWNQLLIELTGLSGGEEWHWTLVRDWDTVERVIR